jgi:hypothetical protein
VQLDRVATSEEAADGGMQSRRLFQAAPFRRPDIRFECAQQPLAQRRRQNPTTSRLGRAVERKRLLDPRSGPPWPTPLGVDCTLDEIASA